MDPLGPQSLMFRIAEGAHGEVLEEVFFTCGDGQ